MMIGEPNHRHNPTVHVPPWTFIDDQPLDTSFPFPVSGVSVNSDLNVHSDGDFSPLLYRYLPSNDVDFDSDSDVSGRESEALLDAYTCDQFRMYEFKVRRCARGRSHDWTDCPYAHPGEKARRRDPRKFSYSGTACPDYRKGNCKKGDVCEFAHGVFECWLHPSRYRTQPCKDGLNCGRRVCFFAHTPEQLRIVSVPSPRSGNSAESYDGSPFRLAVEAAAMSMSPPATPTAESPPMSPIARSLSRSLGSNSVSELVASLRQLQLGKVKSMPSSWNVQVGSPVFGSPRGGSILRPGFCSVPSTPTRAQTRSGIGYLESGGLEEEPVMERVESGRDLRAKMFEKLRNENSLERADPTPPTNSGPDVGWISELLK